MIKIRAAVKSDIPKILEFWQTLIDIHKKGDPEYFNMGPALFRQYEIFLKKNVGSRNAFIYVAEYYKHIVGSMSGEIEKRRRLFSSEKIGMIRSLFVMPQYRKLGISSLLVHDFLDWLKSNKVSYAEVVLYTPSYETVKLWSNLGFDEYMKKFRKKIE